MSRKIFLLAAGFGFLMVLIAAYYGSSVQSAKMNDPIRYLNEMDHIHYYNAAAIPQLNYRAAITTLPIVILIVLAEIWILFKSPFRVTKNVAVGLIMACLFIVIVSFLTLTDPANYDFSLWGYVWMAMGLFIIAGNVMSVFVKKN